MRPEEADVLNVGFSWAPVGGLLEGFQIDLDYYSYEYRDLITRENPNRLLTEDAARAAPSLTRASSGNVGFAASRCRCRRR